MNILDLLIFAPLVAFIVGIVIPGSHKQWALLSSIVIFVASLMLIPGVLSNPANMTYETDIQWIAQPNIRYHVAIDGVSLWLIVLSTLLTPIAVLISWNSIDKRPKEFYAFLLLLEFGLIGVFAALDLFLFYVFWEVSLVPMYFLVGVWGHERRIYAAVKFFLYTMAGSVLMLAAIIYLYNKVDTFDYPTIMGMLSTGTLTLTHLEQTLLFLAFFIAFAIKVPLFPLHTWLPDAHVEAPTAGSVILASVMLKMGCYGLLRFCLPMFPTAARENAPWIVGLAIIGIIYGALVALVQPNIKKLVAYSSVSHLGFVVLGLFSFTQLGLDGAVYIMLAHGLSTGALFMLVGMLYERRHSLDIKDYGGVATAAPWLATAFMITMLASVGLPSLCNFVGEFLVLQGAAIARFEWAVFAAVGVILSACYMLWMYQRVFFGRAPDPDEHHPHFHMPDLSSREWAALVPMIAMMILMGVAANAFLPSIGASNAKALEGTKGRTEQQVILKTDQEVARAN